MGINQAVSGNKSGILENIRNFAEVMKVNTTNRFSIFFFRISGTPGSVTLTGTSGSDKG